MRIKTAFMISLTMTLSLVTFSTAQVPQLCGTGSCIHVGTYNIEWFGTTDTKKHKHRSKAAVRRIASIISDTTDLEVVVLQEINPESSEFTWLKSELEGRGYKLVAGETGGEQRVVIAYDADEVEMINSPESGQGIRELDVRASFELAGNCRSSGLRRPLVGHFKAGAFDFVLIGVHLKSNLSVQGANNPAKCSDEIRKAQADDIRLKIPVLKAEFGEDDVIIAGDFNAEYDDDSLSPLIDGAGFSSLTKPGRLSEYSYNISYLKAPYQEVIDHLLIKSPDTTEWVDRSSRILSPPKSAHLRDKYLEFNSDHVPVWASFRTDMNGQ